MMLCKSKRASAITGGAGRGFNGGFGAFGRRAYDERSPLGGREFGRAGLCDDFFDAELRGLAGKESFLGVSVMVVCPRF